jgi:threonine dehydrogenase-like Zn-dependent dehydrogenase
MPKINSDESLIQVQACGICGTDLHEYGRKFGIAIKLILLAKSLLGRNKFILYGREELTLGHEICGIVHETSRSELQDRRVVVFPDTPRGTCWACQRGIESACINYNNIGFQRAGGFAEYVAVPNKNIFEISRAVESSVATLVEPLSCALHAIEIAGVRKNDNILIVGVGPIGLLIAFICKKEYGANVVACDFSSSRLKAASEIGALRVIKPNQLVDQALFPDVAFDVTGGLSQSTNQIVQITRPRSTICIVGFYEYHVQGVSLRPLQDKEVRIVTAKGNDAKNRQDAVMRVERYANELSRLITKTFPLQEISQAFSFTANHEKTGAIKTVIIP